MENARSSSKMKAPKVKTLNENVPPMQMEVEDQRGRYLQSMVMSPKLQPFAENIDAGSSPLARYFFAASPTSGKVSPAGEAFTSPTFGSSKYSRSTKASSGNSSFGSRGRLSLSPLSSIENMEIAPPLRSPAAMYGTPVKVDEEVLVMDDILVRPTGRSSSSSSGRGSSLSTSSWSPPFVKSGFKSESGNCRYNSKCQSAHGKEELHPTRLSMKSKYEMSKSFMSGGSSSHDPDNRNVNQPRTGAESIDIAVTTSQPASPINPEPHHTLANQNTSNDWSPLDDGIRVALPNNSNPTREQVQAHMLFILLGLTARRRRLAIFEEITKEQGFP